MRMISPILGVQLPWLRSMRGENRSYDVEQPFMQTGDELLRTTVRGAWCAWHYRVLPGVCNGLLVRFV